MSDKKVSKVEYAGETLIDLTGDTVTPETLKSGHTAHSASGEQIVGTNQDVDPSSLGTMYRKNSYCKTDGIKDLSSGAMKMCEITIKDYSKLPSIEENGFIPISLTYQTLMGGLVTLIFSIATENNQIIGLGELIFVNDSSFSQIQKYDWGAIHDSNKVTIVCSRDEDYKYSYFGYFNLLYIDTDLDVIEVTNFCEKADQDIPGNSQSFTDMGNLLTMPFIGATTSDDGSKGYVPAPLKAAVNGDYTLLPTGDWGRLKALGYYTATANTNPNSPANKIVSYLVKSNIAASLSSKLPSANGQNYISIPSDDGNEYAQVSFDTTDNAIYFRTRKKVNDVDTWTAWQQLGTKNTVLTGTLTAGQTSLTISDTAITADSLIDIYTDKYGVNPTNVVSAAGSVTLTFEAQTSDLNVKVVIS